MVVILPSDCGGASEFERSLVTGGWLLDEDEDANVADFTDCEDSRRFLILPRGDT